MKKFIYILSIALMTFACANEPDGKATDTIKPSTRDVYFDSQGGSYTVTTKGEWWSMGDALGIDQEEIDREITLDETGNYPGIIKVEGTWFVVSRDDKTTITISTTTNNTGADRGFLLDLRAGNYYTAIKVKQAGQVNE